MDINDYVVAAFSDSDIKLKFVDIEDDEKQVFLEKVLIGCAKTLKTNLKEAWNRFGILEAYRCAGANYSKCNYAFVYYENYSDKDIIEFIKMS